MDKKLFDSIHISAISTLKHTYLHFYILLSTYIISTLNFVLSNLLTNNIFILFILKYKYYKKTYLRCNAHIVWQFKLAIFMPR